MTLTYLTSMRRKNHPVRLKGCCLLELTVFCGEFYRQRSRNYRDIAVRGEKITGWRTGENEKKMYGTNRTDHFVPDIVDLFYLFR